MSAAQAASANELRTVVRRAIPHLLTAVLTLVLVFAVLGSGIAGALPLGSPSATSTSVIPYHGRLTDGAGTPLTGSYPIVFRLYDVASGGSALWTESWTGGSSVQVSTGLFTALLGSVTPLPQSVVTGHATLWLGITVGTDNEMAPRVQLGSVPYAVQALTVPDGSITIAKLAPDVSLVPPAGSITTTMIADGAITQQKIAAGGLRQDTVTPLQGWVDVSLKDTTSGGLVDVPGCVLSPTFARPVVVLITVAGTITNLTAGKRTLVAIDYDGTAYATHFLAAMPSSADEYETGAVSTIVSLAAGPHTFKCRFHAPDGGIARIYDAALYYVVLGAQ